jgi:hypothetical protein
MVDGGQLRHFVSLQDGGPSELRHRNLRRNSSSTSQVHEDTAATLCCVCRTPAVQLASAQGVVHLVTVHLRSCCRAARHFCGSWPAAVRRVPAATAWAGRRRRPPTQQAQMDPYHLPCRRSARRLAAPTASPDCTRQPAHLHGVCRQPRAAPSARLPLGQQLVPSRRRQHSSRRQRARVHCRQTTAMASMPLRRMKCSGMNPPARQATRPRHGTTWSRCALDVAGK